MCIRRNDPFSSVRLLLACQATSYKPSPSSQAHIPRKTRAHFSVAANSAPWTTFYHSALFAVGFASALSARRTRNRSGPGRRSTRGRKPNHRQAGQQQGKVAVKGRLASTFATTPKIQGPSSEHTTPCPHSSHCTHWIRQFGVTAAIWIDGNRPATSRVVLACILRPSRVATPGRHAARNRS